MRADNMDPLATGSGISNDFTVGSWYVRPALNRISNGSRSVQLEPKVMQMLLILAKRAGEVVSRDELHEQLWSDTIVTDKALTRLASELRKAFGDDPREPRVIATISKSGYRLVAPVSYVSPGNGSIHATRPDVVPMLTPTLGVQPRSRRVRALWLAGVVAMLAAGLVAGTLFSDSHGQYVPAVQLTAYPGHEISPALSPDGNEVAFSWQGASGDNWDIYVKQPGSEGQLRLTSDPGDDLHPTWSPDGTQIAYLHFDADGCSISRVPALSGPIRTVAACTWIDEEDRPYRTSAIDWSPDGRSIAGSDGSIYLLDVETGGRTQISRPPQDAVADINPTFSPDGGTIAFTRIRPVAVADLYSISANGEDESRLTNETQLILGHAWTPDGLSLLFSSNRGGRFGLWRVGASGGKPVAVPADGWNIEKVSVARNGDRIAYEGWIYDTNIWRVTTDGQSNPERIIASTLWDREPSFSPDGNRIAFVSNRSGSWELWTAVGDGSEQKQLTHLDGPVVGVPRWSPDGTRIAFQITDEKGADVRLINVASGLVESLESEPSDEVAPSWSPSGGEVYFGSNRSGSWQIWSEPIGGGEAIQVTSGGGYAAIPSPDGRFLFVARTDTTGLWRIPLGDGPEERILDMPVGSDWGNWAVTEKGIYVLRRRHDEPPLLTLSDFDGASTRELMPLDPAPSPHHPGLSISRDGRSVW